MTVAAPPTPALPHKRPTLSHDFPRVRMAMITHPKGNGGGATKVTVREGFDCVFIDFETPAITEKTISLTLPEARGIADHLNRTCRRITTRPDYRP